MILFLLKRIRVTQGVSKIIFATTTLPEDDELAQVVEDAGFTVFRGANENVVERYIDAAQEYDLDYVVRVTGDCPFVDAETLDYCLISACQQRPFDLASTKGYFPVGVDYEIYKTSVMVGLHAGGKLDAYDREHLTLYMYNNSDHFKLVPLKPRAEWLCNKTFTVDNHEDLENAREVVMQIGRSNFTIAELVEHVIHEN